MSEELSEWELRVEIERLRAELAAEREQSIMHFRAREADIQDISRLVKEQDKLRAELDAARSFADFQKSELEKAMAGQVYLAKQHEAERDTLRAELDAEKECRRQEVEAQQSAFNFLHKENEELREALREARELLRLFGDDIWPGDFRTVSARIDALLEGGGDE